MTTFAKRKKEARDNALASQYVLPKKAVVPKLRNANPVAAAGASARSHAPRPRSATAAAG